MIDDLCVKKLFKKGKRVMIYAQKIQLPCRFKYDDHLNGYLYNKPCLIAKFLFFIIPI